LHRELGGAVQVLLAQADLGQAQFGAERGGEVEEASCRILGVERARSGPSPLRMPGAANDELP
jgi:hypothetical protein